MKLLNRKEFLALDKTTVYTKIVRGCDYDFILDLNVSHGNEGLINSWWLEPLFQINLNAENDKLIDRLVSQNESIKLIEGGDYTERDSAFDDENNTFFLVFEKEDLMELSQRFLDLANLTIHEINKIEREAQSMSDSNTEQMEINIENIN